MTKIRIIIYSLLLTILLFALFASIFGLLKKGNNQNISNSPTPTPIPIIEITWTEAIDLIQNCQIKTVFQKHNLEVTLTSKDNNVFKTIEPKLDDVFIETNHLRSDCNDLIQTITE